MKTPALDAWREELAARERTATTFDPLWRAACEEVNALEAADPPCAAPYIARARQIIRAAQKGLPA